MSALDKQEGGNHYKNMKIQPIEYIVGNNFGWHEGNIVKYISRHGFKNGVEDVKKVIHYAELLLEQKYGEKPDKFLTEEQGKEVLRHAGAYIPQEVLVLKGLTKGQVTRLVGDLTGRGNVIRTKSYRTQAGYNLELFESPDRVKIPELPDSAPDFQ